MKILSVRTITVAFVFLLCLPFSCIKDDCPTDTGSSSRLNVRQMGIAVGSVKKFPNSVGDFSTIKTMHADSIAIQLSVLDFFYEATAHVILEDHMNFTWGSQAFACSEPPILRAINSVSTIEITSSDTISSLGTVYLPNQSLNQLFEASYYGNKETISQAITQLNESFYMAQSNLILILKDEIDPIKNHELTVKISLDDGNVFDLTSSEFEIQ